VAGGRHLGAFPDGSAEDVDRAVDAATAASESWSETEWTERAALLRTLSARLDHHTEEFARLDSMDSGNPIRAMRVDASRAAGQLLYFSGLAAEVHGATYPRSADSYALTVREPYPVVGRIIPYNHPFMFAVGRMAAPLAAGCTVILKPAEQTSLSALALGEVIAEVFPPGVVNIVTGRGETVGSALVQHPHVPRIAFTGSAATGKRVLSDAAPHVKNVSLELGGKNPFIVLPDIDVEIAAAAAVKAMNFTTVQAQSCGATSKVLVHSSQYDTFVNAVIEAVEELKLGDPLEDETDMGPLISEDHLSLIVESIDAAVADGATLLTGGKRPKTLKQGYYLEPTVLGAVDEQMQIATEEVFGPVMTISAWNEYDELIRAANNSSYGLTANVWTNDLSLATKISRRIHAGYVWLNGHAQRPPGVPFGGHGISGLGYENSMEELESYTELKSIIMRPAVDTAML